MPYPSAKLIQAPSKAHVSELLNSRIVECCAESIDERGIFTIALSGGSLPSFLATLPRVFWKHNVEPRFQKWHVLLVDERCVPSSHDDSNLGALRKHLLSNVPIPPEQVYGIDEEVLVRENTSMVAANVAQQYEPVVREVLSRSGGELDLAVLGFGPDGHTCSLFPGHELLKEDTKWVASIDDSPKPPPKRITLTLPLLNSKTRHVIFCGAGSSKGPILERLFSSMTKDQQEENVYNVELVEKTPFPCGMVRANSLTYIVDTDAMKDWTNRPPLIAKVVSCESKKTLPRVLNKVIAKKCAQAIEERDVFTVALSGGSIPSFLSSLPEAFVALDIDPQFEKWHVILADERCVPATHEDSNMGALRQHLFSKIPDIPDDQIMGIDEAILATQSTAAVATDYEEKVRTVIARSGDQLDLALLGFGPDGHTCSLFPNHVLLAENAKWVASIEDSPKPPAKRITLTFPFLNTKTRQVVFCGAGSSKAPVLQSTFSHVVKDKDHTLQATLCDPATLPCGMVRPDSGKDGALTFVCDEDALDGVNVLAKAPVMDTDKNDLPTESTSTTMCKEHDLNQHIPPAAPEVSSETETPVTSAGASVGNQVKMEPYEVTLLPVRSKKHMDIVLNEAIVERSAVAIKERGCFTIALSGGSLPAFLSTIENAFTAKEIVPNFDKWFVILADERCVPSTHEDSNLGALRKHLLSKVAIPAEQVYGIDEEVLQRETSDAATAVADSYEPYVRMVMVKSGGQLDLAVLGFGPDGHTCSLFPGHELLIEETKWVAAIEDSPKPPPQRITLTLPVLNTMTRHVIFCGAGSSKAPILQKVFAHVGKDADRSYHALLTNPPPYPCAMVRPDKRTAGDNSVTFVCDVAALEGVNVMVTSDKTKEEAVMTPATEAFWEPSHPVVDPFEFGPYVAELIPAKSKDTIGTCLNEAIVDHCEAAIGKHGAFTIALSGGSLPGFLATIKEAFESKGVDPHFEKWFVILADERCVPLTDKDSNMGALVKLLFSKITAVPPSQIFGITPGLSSPLDIATDYEACVKTVVAKSGGCLDLAVLGFGPDGHTCSLFPDHDLLKEDTKWVAPIEDSPKPPPKRITLTLPFLNTKTRHVIFCGAGSSKAPILQSVFACVNQGRTDGYSIDLTNPPPYPCGMVRPNTQEDEENTVTFVCDYEALEGVRVVQNEFQPRCDFGTVVGYN